MLELQNITKQFGDFTAVDELSFQVPEGQIFGLLGANGAGKTTTFRMLLGILQPTTGSITWKGKAIPLSQIGYLPEERGLYPKIRVDEQLIFLAELRGMRRKEAKASLVAWLDYFQIPQYEKMRVEQLSKGNQQKIQLISAVLHKPDLLILDEPFSGLDPVNVEQLKKAVRKLTTDGTTIVFSSHRMDHVEELCEHVAILDHGKPVVAGYLPDIKAGYGKTRVLLATDAPPLLWDALPGILQVETEGTGYTLQVESKEAADGLLRHLITEGFHVERFVWDQLSLQDIFIEEVGKRYEP
ncbi:MULTISPECIES: ABC transporter ATP-binding protein [unclassified Exiguobacterium]|uniref:ABC transporter ATP-binding protein n=1 Tax=unclassified Exiguobacterium TaxID=2644629 RepID=UPI000B589F44|nr:MULTISPECIES: ABC transporter ATP-binding protein [unclassified Exiguobacterium]ASI36319.1 sodium ABC transporter ATP-binding protein [Exiguobacterium sp. N4-1P]